MKIITRIRNVIILVLISTTIIGCIQIGKNTEDIFLYDNSKSSVAFDNAGYELNQVLMISRHNIRSPLSGKDSLLGQITPHEWYAWTSNHGDLSIKGGQVETAMGQFFRKYLEKKCLFSENWIPKEDEVRFYSNSLQRTIATAHFFASGLLPVANPNVEYHNEIGVIEPIFCPAVPNISPSFEEQVRKEIYALGGDEGMSGIINSLKEPFSLLEKVLDFKDSKYAKEKNMESIPLDDIEFEIDADKGVIVTGGLKIADSAVDALKLQIYEENDLDKALFGHKMSIDEIKKICEISDIYRKICGGSKTFSTHAMNEMIDEMKKELNTEKRKFTFLCGHDSTIAALTTALDIKPYKLPGIISCITPIGGKIVFEKYQKDDGKEYVKVFMCYNTTSQIRNCEITSIENPPMFYELEFEGLDKNVDGYYSFDDIIEKFDEVLSQ